MSYAESLEAEVASWCIANDDDRFEKLQREYMRGPKLVRDLLLDILNTREFSILEVGGGPTPISDFLEFRDRVVVDPCTESYREYFHLPDHVEAMIEGYPAKGQHDLVICTNALDHVENPMLATKIMAESLKPGGWLAIMCAEHNAITNPHPAHVHNLSAEVVHRWLDHEFETVWELTYSEHDYRYGWVLWEGKRGQPAFALLMRKCSGYER